jgi:hypothetical protein
MPQFGLGLGLPKTKLSSPAFDPGTLANLSLWLKADAGISLSGSNVIGWADLSGSGNDAYTGPSESDPIFISNAVNGKPAIQLSDFSTARAFTLDLLPTGLSGTTAFAVVYVEDVTAEGEGDDNGPIFGNFGSGAGSHYPYSDGLVYDGFASTTRKDTLTPPVPITTEWSIYSVHSQTGDWKAYVNNQLMYSTSTNTYNNQAGGGDNTLYIGKQTSGGDYYLKGKIAEAIIYSRVLTTTERQKVTAYLNQKYAIY